MKTLFLELNMGASGDMLMAALLELVDNQEEFLAKLNNIGLPSVSVTKSDSVKCGLKGTHLTTVINGESEQSIDIDISSTHVHNNDNHHEHDHNHDHPHEHNHVHEHHHEHEHSHNDMHGIEHTINDLSVSDKVKKDAFAIYKIIAEAESIVHGVAINKIHFHEVGEMDAISDIVGVCMLFDMISPDKVIASPVHVGSGLIHCAHGTLPVPAPAAALILRGIPIYGGAVRGELCTPTGAALLKYFVHEFAAMPAMSVDKIGYGMGTKDFECANCVRAFYGDTENIKDEIIELSCNLDDITPEELSFAVQILLNNGAKDAYTIPINMKKGRSAQMLCCLCEREVIEKMAELIFKHTTTLGIREAVMKRHLLQRDEYKTETPFGIVRIKTAIGYGVRRSKAEHDDLAKIAKEQSLSLEDVKKLIDINEKI